MNTHQEKRVQFLKDRLDDRRRRRREVILIIVFALVLLLMFYLEIHLSSITEKAAPGPMTTGFIFFLFWNLMVILGLVVIFYTVRNVVKLVFERRHGVLGSHLRLKLVGAFLTLTFGPAVVFFSLSTFFLNTSIERWFDPQVQNVFDTSKEIIRSMYDEDGQDIIHFARMISEKVSHDQLISKNDQENLRGLVTEKRNEYNLSLIEVYDAKGEELIRVAKPNLTLERVPQPSADSLSKALAGQEGYYSEQMGPGDILRGFEPVFSSADQDKTRPLGVVVVSKFMAKSLSRQLRQNIRALEEYEQLKSEEPMIKRQHWTLLILTTIGVIFLAVWFGLYLAKGITVPIQLLAEGTEAVAAGDLEYRIDVEADDEIGTLVSSFNQMTEDLSASRTELERRRQYMEIVLRNVAAGVLSLDRENRISTINKAAEKMLGLSADKVLGRPYTEVLADEYKSLVDELMGPMKDTAVESIQRQASWYHEGKTQVMIVTLNVLRQEDGAYLGLVAVIEDITTMLRAQRASAWREVARRIAHEIKNPLTPIKLAAQRLERRYLDRPDDPSAEMIAECTGTIVKQVDELKNLVNEFSNFARLPAANPAPADLNQLIREVMALYREAHRHIEFEFIEEKRLPMFELDREQINRVLINLLDNAVASIDGQGRVTIETMYNEQLQIARLEVRDTGSGISAQDRDKLFEPYFSTKPHGSGLGLAIVHRIISDHNGYIRVTDNKPQGTIFAIELPVVTADMVSESGDSVRIIS